MRVIAFGRLRMFISAGHADAEGALRAWFHTAEHAEWSCMADVLRDFPRADLVGDRIVFNIGGNKYRLISVVDFERHGLLVRFIGTHAEYDRIDVRSI